MLRSGIVVVLVTPTARRTAALVMFSTAASTGSTGASTTSASSAAVALLHVTQPLAQWGTSAGGSCSLEQQPSQREVEVERISTRSTHYASVRLLVLLLILLLLLRQQYCLFLSIYDGDIEWLGRDCLSGLGSRIRCSQTMIVDESFQREKKTQLVA